MTNELLILRWSAASIGFVHTILGPDHYVPFIMIGKARNWSMPRTIGTMTLAVWIASLGLSQINLNKLQPLSHFVAGIIIFASGMSIQFLGL